MIDRKGQKCVDIGGQAVLEGVMMKSPDAIAIAVRKEDDSIVVKRETYIPISQKYNWAKLPIIRGIMNMGVMFSMGMRTLQTSTTMLGVMEEEPSKFEKWLSKTFGKSVEKVMMGVAVVLAIALSVGLFIVIPETIAAALRRKIDNKIYVNLIGGLVRIAILIGYMALSSLMPEIKRTFQYHGAEHKTVYCFENNLPLTPENADKFSTLHPRCGTSFILIVFVLAVLLYTVAGYNGSNYILRVLSRLALLPLVAGISYEVLKGLAHAKSKFALALRWPGLMMQKITTKKPDYKMLEIAIVAMKTALYGMPEGELTEEGYTRFVSFEEFEKSQNEAIEELSDKVAMESSFNPASLDIDEAGKAPVVESSAL